MYMKRTTDREVGRVLLIFCYIFKNTKYYSDFIYLLSYTNLLFPLTIILFLWKNRTREEEFEREEDCACELTAVGVFK